MKKKTSKGTQTDGSSLQVSLGDPTDTQNEPKTSFSSLKPDDFVQFLEYISFPQQSALKHLLTDER